MFVALTVMWSLMSLTYYIGFTNCNQCVCMVQYCFTSAETIRLIRAVEPRTTTLTFTQLLNPVALMYALRPLREVRRSEIVISVVIIQHRTTCRQ